MWRDIMYERNAIVLERYFEKKFGFDKTNNIKLNYTNFSDLLEELEKYQIAVLEEEKIIQTFDEIAQKIQIIQKKQEKLCATNEKLEEERNRLFNLLDENPSTIENKLEKSEENCTNVFQKYNIEIDEETKSKLNFIKYGIFDLIFQNCFLINNEYYFYDQEWIEENIPLEFIIYRAITYLCNSEKDINSK